MMLLLGGMMLGGCYRVEKRQLIYGDDAVGGNFGPNSPEMSDNYLR